MGRHSTAAVEPKVTAATVGAYLGGLALTVLVQALQDGSLIAALPATWSAILTPVVPALIALGAGYLARHEDRPEA